MAWVLTPTAATGRGPRRREGPAIEVYHATFALAHMSLPEVVQICVFSPKFVVIYYFCSICYVFFYKGIVFYFVKILFYCIILIMYRVSRPYLRAAVCVMRGMALSLSRSLSVLWSSPTVGLVTGALSWAVCMLRAACCCMCIAHCVHANPLVNRSRS